MRIGICGAGVGGLCDGSCACVLFFRSSIVFPYPHYSGGDSGEDSVEDSVVDSVVDSVLDSVVDSVFFSFDFS